MEPWVWLVASLVGFALLQVALYRYFRGETSEDRSTGKPGARTDTGRQFGESAVQSTREDRSPEGATEGVHCTHCGARNERNAVFTYCRRCVQPL